MKKSFVPDELEQWKRKAKEKLDLYGDFLEEENRKLSYSDLSEKSRHRLEFCRDEIDSLRKECPEPIFGMENMLLHQMQEDIINILESNPCRGNEGEEEGGHQRRTSCP